jgi:hypothetical protein
MMRDDLAPPLRLSLQVFALFIAIYLFTWGGHYTSGDGSIKVAWAKDIIAGNWAQNGGDNQVHSKYGIGHSLLAAPPLAIASLVQKTAGVRCEAALYTLMFVANGAFFLGLVAFYLAHFYPARSVWGTVLIAGLATTWWPYTKLDFSEPLVLTIAFLGFVLMRFKHPGLGMLVAGFTLAIRADSIAVVGLLALWYLAVNPSIRGAVRIGLALIPSIALTLFANYIRYHSLLDHGYAGERFSNPLLVGLYGILLSGGKSILLFSPPLLLGVLGWKRFANRPEIAPDARLFLGIFVAQVLIYSKWWDWSSDDAWGVRFLIPGVMVMCIPMVTMLHRRVILVPLVVLGFCVQLPAVTVGGLDYLILLRSHQFERQALFVGGPDRIDFEDIRFNPSYSQIAGNWILLRHLLGIPPSPGDPQDAARLGTRLYDALPPQAWASAAHWDFIWNLRRSARPAADPQPAR